jgi:hypothetical protein
VVVPPRVVRRERTPLLVVRRVPDELLEAGIRQRMDRAVEAELRERLRLAPPRPEAGAPEEALRLRGTERTAVCRNSGHSQVRWPPAAILSPRDTKRAPEGALLRLCPPSRKNYSDSSRVGNGEGSREPNPPSTPGAGTSGRSTRPVSGVVGSRVPVVPVRLAPERARAALPVDPAAPVRRDAVGVARELVRPELLRPVRRPVVRFAAAFRFAGRRLAVVRFAAVFRFAVVRLAAVFRLVAVFRFAVLFRFVALLRLVAVFRLAVVRFAALLRLVAVFRFAVLFRLVAVFRLAVVRFAAVLRFAVLFRLVAVFRLAVVRFAVVRLAVVRLAVVRFAAGRRFAVDRFAAVRFVPVLFLVAICLLLLGEFGGNDSAQYAPTIGRFHHLLREFLR